MIIAITITIENDMHMKKNSGDRFSVDCSLQSVTVNIYRYETIVTSLVDAKRVSANTPSVREGKRGREGAFE